MQKECINWCNWFQIFKQENHASFYATTCSLNQFDEKISHMKILKFWNFETKGCKGNESFNK
jgi:hypothetical protein